MTLALTRLGHHRARLSHGRGLTPKPARWARGGPLPDSGHPSGRSYPGLSSLELLSGSTLSCVVTGLLIHSPHIPVLGWTWLVPLTFPGTSSFKYLAVNPHFWIITYLIRSPRSSHTTLRPLPRAGPPHSPGKTAPHRWSH